MKIKPTVLYLCGPMSNWPDLNFPEFRRAAQALREAGHTVVDPSRRTPEDHPEWTWLDYMRDALRDVSVSEGLALLDGWELSRGALLEHYIAVALGFPARPWKEWL